MPTTQSRPHVYLSSGLIPVIILYITATISFSQTPPSPTTQPAYHGWSNTPRPFQRPSPNPDAKKLPLIRVQGNRFVDPAGNPILFRGVSIADPDKIDHQGHWNKALFEHVKEMGANLVRIPVHPAAWRERTPEKYLELLDQAVAWCTDLNMHVIIDWHSIGNLQTEIFQDPMYDTSHKETFTFWETIARHFRGNNTVAFYELFNEPSTSNQRWGPSSWSEWKKINETMIAIIRAHDPERIELVAGFDWAYDLTPLREEPISADNIGYVTHPYANKRSRPWEPKWDEDFAFAAGKYPLIATEIGFSARDNQPVDDDHYGNRITRFLESKNISWMAWVYDPEWSPQLLKDWNFNLTPAGEFFKRAMHREIYKAQ
jgi:endoglucanase